MILYLQNVLKSIINNTQIFNIPIPILQLFFFVFNGDKQLSQSLYKKEGKGNMKSSSLLL